MYSNRIAEGQRALARKAKAQGKKFQGRDRPIEQVTGIVLHQMGFTRGDAIEKYFPVTAHFVIAPNGDTAQLHGLEESLWSSNALNKFTCAVEFAGNFRNDKGRWWRGGGEDRLTTAQIVAGRDLLRQVASSYGIRHVYAHRQGAGKNKSNCCGPEIWYEVAEWACENGIYENTSYEFYGAGSCIPASWIVYQKKEQGE